jgi:predicted regulator of Ras-like GTPase activity (Roadblock/LC7/MglB family)
MTGTLARRLIPVLTQLVQPHVHQHKHKILLIHESNELRNIMQLSMVGEFDVRTASNAEDGWHAMLTDQNIRAVAASLPVLEIDGFGLLQRIRRSKVSRINGAPVLVISDNDESIGDLATSIGASGFTPLGDLGGMKDRLIRLIEPAALVSLVDTAPSQGASLVDLPLPLEEEVPPAADVASVRVKLIAPAPAPAPVSEPGALDYFTAPQVPIDPHQPHPEKENPMSRLDDLNKILKNLQNSSQGVEASALISSDGLMIASALAKDMDETRVSAMTATLLNLGTRAAIELRRGEVTEVIVRGDQGYAVMLSAGRGALLLVLANEGTPLGLIFFDMREAVKGIKNVL